jgi:hypothetical protein
MKGMVCAVAAVLFAGSAWAFPDDKPQVRLLKDVKPAESKDYGNPKPVEIKSADDLAKSKAFDDAGRDAVKKAVNFEKEKVVVFAWSGSGRDRLAGELSKDGKSAVFTYKVGETDDLRRHSLAFAVPKDAKVEVKK